jgi:peptidoglycan hydrolase CwlO-like protein
MLSNITDQAVQGLGMVALAVIAVLVGVQKILKDWRSTAAETNVITLMHSELERMSEQNTKLSVELGRLHTEIIGLNTELQKLTVENQRLQTEVVALTNEISELKALTRKDTNGKIKTY